jgi:hypothetical protein
MVEQEERSNVALGASGFRAPPVHLTGVNASLGFRRIYLHLSWFDLLGGVPIRREHHKGLYPYEDGGWDGGLASNSGRTDQPDST